MSTETKDPIEIVLEHLSVVRIRPGDTLVFRLPHDSYPCEDEIKRIRDRLARAFADRDIKTLVLVGGMELSVLRQEVPTPIPFPPPDEGGR